MSIANVVVLILCVTFLRWLLCYSISTVEPEDCIVLLSRTEIDLRKQEARRLIKKGYAKSIYLLISDQNYSKLRKDAKMKHFENTHIELVVAHQYIYNNSYKRELLLARHITREGLN